MLMATLLHRGRQQQRGDLHQRHRDIGERLGNQGCARQIDDMVVGNEIAQQEDVESTDERRTLYREAHGQHQQQHCQIDEGIGQVTQDTDGQQGTQHEERDKLPEAVPGEDRQCQRPL